jgi:hypothetical protein
MRITKTSALLLGLLLTCFLTAHAEGARSYISPNGHDNRPCSLQQPCRSFDGALANTDAGGEIVAVETGVYDPTTITKSITLAAAPGADVVILATAGNAVTINANGGDEVVLRGLRLGGPGKNVAGTNGVFVTIESSCCVTVNLQDCIVTGFENGVNMDVNVAGRLIVSDTVVRSNVNGIKFSAGGALSFGASIERSRLESNTVGLRLSSSNPVSVSNTVATGNITGFLADPGSSITIFHSVMTKNSTGLRTTGGTIKIAYCSVTGNNTGVSIVQGSVSSMGNNMIVDNDSDIIGGSNFTTFLPK